MMLRESYIFRIERDEASNASRWRRTQSVITASILVRKSLWAPIHSSASLIMADPKEMPIAVVGAFNSCVCFVSIISSLIQDRFPLSSPEATRSCAFVTRDFLLCEQDAPAHAAAMWRLCK